MSLTNADSRLTSRPEPDEQPDLALPSHFNNRELSLLEFNRRVLEQAKDQRTPLLERFFQQIPVVKSVFSVVQQMSAVFLRDQRRAFQDVVVFAYPRPGLYSLGFVTRDEEGDDLVNVFLPTAPNPTSGFMLLMPRAEIRSVDIPVEDAIKLIVSGGSIMSAAQADAIRTRIDMALPAGRGAPAHETRPAAATDDTPNPDGAA